MHFWAVITILMFSIVSCSSKDKKENNVYVQSLGSIESQLAYNSASQVLKTYESQLKYRIQDPKQDFLHELNLGALSLLANQPRKSRQHFINASAHIDWQNYTSILNETSEVLLLKTVQERYRLQPQEYLNLQYMQAMTYILENDWKNALVSVRALHGTLRRIENNLNNQPIKSFAFYYWFAGYVYEENKLYDDARIDYEVVQRLNPEWKNLDLHLWKVYALTEDKEKEPIYAAKVNLQSMPLKQRLVTAKGAHFQYIFANQMKRQDWLNFQTANVHIERKEKNQDFQMWGQDQSFLALSQNHIDREIAEKGPKKMDNPAYLLHVNPYSITYMVFGTIFKTYWDILKPEGEPEFVVNSFSFHPRSVSLIYLNACWKNDASCTFKSYSGNVANYVIPTGNIYVMQFQGDSSMIAFK